MSNIKYESNKDSYDNLKAFIEEQLEVAISLVDQSSERKWKEQLQLLVSWIKSEGESDCPISEATWEAAGIPNPSTFAESFPQDTSPQEVFADLLSKVQESLSDESKVGNLLRNYENLLAWIRDPKNVKETKDHAKEIDALLNEVKGRRLAKSREILKSIQATENLYEKKKLIQEAENWNPADKEIAKDIESIRGELIRGLSVEEIRRHFVYLQSARRSDLMQFETSLRELEERKAVDPGFFSADDELKIQEAREYFDDLRTKGGQRTSMVATKDLVDTFVVYREIQQANTDQVFYQDVLTNRAEVEAELQRFYREASKRRLQELISTAKGMVSNSPTAAISYIDRQLTGRIERVINKTTEQIDEVPLHPEDKDKLLAYKASIDQEDRPKEDIAKQELELSTKAVSLFDRVSHLIKSFTSFPLANVKDQIKQLVEAASEDRLNTIELQFEKLESDLERLKEMHLDSIPAALEKLRGQLTNFDTMLTQDWFGVPGYDIVSKSEKFSDLNLPPRPIKLNDYSLQHRGQKRTDLGDAILKVESAVDTIRQVSITVEQKLKEVDPPDITGSIQEFNAIRDRLDLAPYRAFKVLEQLISQHQGLIEKRNRLKQFMEQYKYRELLDYFYSNIAETKEFLNASQPDKSEINAILKEAELEAHTLLLDKHFKAENLKAAQIEMNWLRDHNMISERNRDITSQLEKLLEDSSALEEFYLQAFGKIGIKQGDLLPTIYSLLPSLLSSLQEDSISPSDKEELMGLIDESMTEIDEAKILHKLSSNFSRYNFSIIYDFVNKVLYCGRYEIDKKPDWPLLSQHSVIEFDARRIAPLLKELIKERIQNDLGSKKRISFKVLEELLLAYQHFSLQGDIEYDAAIEEKAKSVAYNLQSELERSSLIEQLNLWTLMAKVFPRSSLILSQLKKIQVSYYSDALKKKIHDKHWPEAMSLITNIRSLVTHTDLLDLQFTFFTHIDNKEYFSVTEAETILEGIKAFGPDEQYLAEREADLIVAEALQRSDFNLLTTIQVLNTPIYLANQKIKEKRNSLGRRLNNKKNQQLQNHRDNQDYSAMVLTLSDIYTISSTLEMAIDKSVSDLINDRTFKTQVPLIAEQLRKDSQPQEKTKLQSSIKRYEELIPTLSGLLRILSDGYQIDDRTPIHQQLGVQSASGNNVYKKDLEEVNAVLINALNQVRVADKLVHELKDQQKWINPITNSIQGIENAWSVLEDEFTPLQDTVLSDFIDIATLIKGFKKWEEVTHAVSKAFGDLQRANSRDDTQECKNIIQRISETIVNSPNVFDTEFTDKLKAHIESCLRIRQYGKTTHHIGLDEISRFIEIKEEEIGKLTAQENSQKANFENVENLIKRLSLDKRKWKEKLLSTSKLDQEYLNQINIFLGDTSSIAIAVTEPPDEQDMAGEVQVDRLFTKIIGFIKKSSDDKKESKLHRDLDTDFNGITIEDQLEKLKEVLRYYKEIQYPIQQEHLSDKAKSISDAINANNQKASTKEMLLLPVIQVAEEILTVVKESRKSPDEITAMWHNKQFNRIAMYLIEISPHINLDDYLMKQKNIILSKV